jgi:hypothetical protein
MRIRAENFLRSCRELNRASKENFRADQRSERQVWGRSFAFVDRWSGASEIFREEPANIFQFPN